MIVQAMVCLSGPLYTVVLCMLIVLAGNTFEWCMHHGKMLGLTREKFFPVN